MYQRIGHGNREYSHTDALHMPAVVSQACLSGVKSCVVRAVEDFEIWMNSEDPDNSHMNP